MSSHRMSQLSELIRQQLGSLFVKELELPSGYLVTITRVKTSKDLSYADISVSILPIDKSDYVMELLDRKKKEFQSILAKKIFITTFPTLRFHTDETEKKAARIEELIDSLNDKS